MEPIHDNTWEYSLEQMARQFEYPATPDLAAKAIPVARRRPARRGPRSGESGRRRAGGRLAWVLVIIALLIAAALAVPQTRAAVMSLFARIGAIDIFIDDAAPTATPPADKGGFIAPPPTAVALAATPNEWVDHSMALFELGEAVTLDKARQLADFDLALPDVLGAPDEVYNHSNVDLPALTLVWRDEAGAPLSLTEIGIGEFAMKMVGEEGVRHILVNDKPAVWIEGPHLVQLLGYRDTNSLLIESNVLIWAVDGVTYRLEGDLDEAEMIAVAKSLDN